MRGCSLVAFVPLSRETCDMQTRLPQMPHNHGALRGHPLTSHTAHDAIGTVLLEAAAMAFGPVTVTETRGEREGTVTCRAWVPVLRLADSFARAVMAIRTQLHELASSPSKV